MNAAILLILGLPIALAVLAGCIVLQVYLAKRTSILPGLILPVLFLAGTGLLSAVLFYLLDTARAVLTVPVLGGMAVVTFVVILVVVRHRRPKPAARKTIMDENKELDRMNIQDLG